MTVLTETYSTAPTFGGRVAALRDALADAASKRKVYRDTLRELQSMGPRELDDLGIAPGSLRQIAYDAAYGA